MPEEQQAQENTVQKDEQILAFLERASAEQLLQSIEREIESLNENNTWKQELQYALHERTELNAKIKARKLEVQKELHGSITVQSEKVQDKKLVKKWQGEFADTFEESIGKVNEKKRFTSTNLVLLELDFGTLACNESPEMEHFENTTDGKEVPVFIGGEEESDVVQILVAFNSKIEFTLKYIDTSNQEQKISYVLETNKLKTKKSRTNDESYALGVAYSAKAYFSPDGKSIVYQEPKGTSPKEKEPEKPKPITVLQNPLKVQIHSAKVDKENVTVDFEVTE